MINNIARPNINKAPIVGGQSPIDRKHKNGKIYMQTYKYQYANDTSRPRVHVLGPAMLRSDICSGY